MTEHARAKASEGLVVGIDASNLSGGGGLTHLVELLGHARPGEAGVRQVVVWGPQATLQRLSNRTWLSKQSSPSLEAGPLRRAWWQRTRLGACALRCGCHVLFVPGGSVTTRFRPVVTMSRNMLPFEAAERRRYGWSWMRLRLTILRAVQARSLARADGTIFLTRDAERVIAPQIGSKAGRVAVIPHGIGERFRIAPRPARALEDCSRAAPFRLLYVSIVDVYKHQATVVCAVASLRARGLPVELLLAGGIYGPAWQQLKKTLDEVDPDASFVRPLGPVAHERLHELYRDADAAVFASSCENMPNILLEKMAAGLPIACSDRGPMPDLLGPDGLYFDPESPTDCTRALEHLVRDRAWREKAAADAYARAQRYSWDACAKQTFEFIRSVAPAVGAAHG